jgi:hypothetical protein
MLLRQSSIVLFPGPKESTQLRSRMAEDGTEIWSSRRASPAKGEACSYREWFATNANAVTWWRGESPPLSPLGVQLAPQNASQAEQT